MPNNAPPIATQLPAASEPRGPLRLLIVDDDLVQRELLKRGAGRAGYEVSLAASCREAIDRLQSQAFDCVILDLELGDGDGTDVCRAMARTSYSGSIIIISGTAASRRSAARAFARSMGIEAQGLPKPVDLASLRVCLANLCKDLQGLPAIHAWGGTAVGRTKEAHRGKATPAARSPRHPRAASHR
jgi:CheY-like chemotaxis protein